MQGRWGREAYWDSGKIQAKNNDERNTSSVLPEHTSLDEALEEINEKMEETDQLHNQRTQKNPKNVQQDVLKTQERGSLHKRPLLK